MAAHTLLQSARRDLKDIAVFSAQRWGDEQAQKYHDDLEDVFKLPAQRPRMGRLEENISAGLMRFEHASHVILYRRTSSGISNVRVMHKNRRIASNTV
jgi:toxin ParE1/3/4